MVTERINTESRQARNLHTFAIQDIPLLVIFQRKNLISFSTETAVGVEDYSLNLSASSGSEQVDLVVHMVCHETKHQHEFNGDVLWDRLRSPLINLNLTLKGRKPFRYTRPILQNLATSIVIDFKES